MRLITDSATDAAVRLGLAAYRPEHRSADGWSDSYRSGALTFYEDLEELSRYSVVAGYVGWVATRLGRPADVVDIGCGTGLLHGRLDPARVARYVGVDLSDAAIEEARATSAGAGDVTFLVGDAAALQLGSADVVVLNEMLYYVDRLEPLLRRVESSAPSGHAVVSMWRHPGDGALWKALDRRWHLVDAVDVRNRSNRVNARGWRVAMYDLGRPTAG